MANKDGETIVVSGMAGLYPDCRNVKELCNILYNKVYPISEEKARWHYDHPEVSHFTGTVPEITKFDSQFFKVHHRLGNNMDPMCRKILEQTYVAIYDAGLNPADLSGKKVSVYVGSNSESEKVCLYSASIKSGLGMAGCSKAMFANRVSYWLNTKGPSMSVDQGCSSSMVALELAYLDLKRGVSEAAIVAGGTLCLHPQSSIHYGRILKQSADGKVKSFADDATGCVKSEAINVIFLQKAKDALRIYAELINVKNNFVSLCKNEEGPKYGFCRNPSTMANFAKHFYEEISISPEAVEYIEGFGSAVPEADKTELEAIEEIFCKSRKDPLLVGSVISNIGYTSAASGISALTKVLLGYHTGKIAANLHCEQPRQDVTAIRDGRMRIVTDHQTFNRTYAAVNNMSLTGANAHVLLHGRYKPKDPLRYKTSIPQLIAVSGRQQSSVQKIFMYLKSRTIDLEELALLRNIYKTGIVGHLSRGFALLDSNEFGLTTTLTEKINNFDKPLRPLWFVYSGMGSQWAGMGAMLMRIPIFASAIERCRIALEPKGIDVVQIITNPNKDTLDNILHSFVGIAAIQIGLTDILNALEIYPDNIIGHSVGEVACAYADGCLTTEETILSAYYRGLVSLQIPSIKGSMAAVGKGYKEISSMCPPEIEVVCHNGPDSCTISGPVDIMKDFVAYLCSENIFAKEVPCSNIAYHSRYIAQLGPHLFKYLNEVIQSKKLRSGRWLSTSVPEERWNEAVVKYASAEYFTNNLLNPVLFEETLCRVPRDAVLVEIAPHGLLQAILKRSLPASCCNIPLTRRGHSDSAKFLLEAVGNLYMEGFNPNIGALYPKIEYPVSTETPMLSHLVEWAHNEQWNIPVYMSVYKKSAAACNYVISTHDDENNFLEGHIIRGKNTYPLAAVLVAVWDTLANVMGEKRRKMSVEFKDIRQHSELPLHDMKQLHLNIALHRGTGKFEVLGQNIKIVSGYITSEINRTAKINQDVVCKENLQLKTDDIYQLLRAKDYNYSGDFCSIYNADLTFASAHIQWHNENWVTLIDGIIQLNALQRNHETISQPYFIRKMTIDIHAHSKACILSENGVTVVPTKVDKVGDYTSCGGVCIETIRFRDLPPINKTNIALKTMTFVPRITTNKFDKISILYTFLQIITKHLKKDSITVVEVIENGCNESEARVMKEVAKDIPSIQITYRSINKNEAFNHIDFLQDSDLLVVRNITSDPKLFKNLHLLRQQNSFVVNIESLDSISCNHPPSSPVYHTVSTHTMGSTRLQLALWQPSNIHGIWEGEFYLPILENQVKGKNMSLEIKRYGDLESLHWIEAPKHNNAEINILVHYAAINDVEVKKKQGIIHCDKKYTKGVFDFSGETASGVRVMGISNSETIRSQVQARPELIWPVPQHWSLEDAATVPLAYSLAFYCLGIKTKWRPNLNILVRGATGALGQAVISIALAHGCNVFASVSDMKKKVFLKNVFPDLKDENIAVSRHHLADMTLYATKGKGCDLIINCVHTEYKNKISLKYCSAMGTVIDTTMPQNHEDSYLEPYGLRDSRSFLNIDFSSIFNLNEGHELKQIQRMVSEGIARGYVRPLTRVTFAAQDVSRAYRLQASNRHRGRVLLNLQHEFYSSYSKIYCSPNLYQLLVCGNEALDLQLADRLIKRGARKLILLCSNVTNKINYKIRIWAEQGVDVQVIDNYDFIAIIGNKEHINDEIIDLIENVYYTHSCNHKNEIDETILERLILTIPKMTKLQNFTIISDINNNPKRTLLLTKSIKHRLIWIHIKDLNMVANNEGDFISSLHVVDAIEKAVCSKQQIIIVYKKLNPKTSLLQEISSIADIDFSNETSKDPTLKDLRIDAGKYEDINKYIQSVYQISLDKENISTQSLTVQKMAELENVLSDNCYEDTDELKTFISYVDEDELLATAEMVVLPTHTNLLAEYDAEFDVNQPYICIIPGVEGHHSRFRALSKQLKLAAFVLQPNWNKLNETIQEMAYRYTEILIKKTKLKNRFYLMAYESGVMVALKMAEFLEEKGFTGTVFCIGGGPSEVKAIFKEKLRNFKNEKELQDGVLRHMFTLMTNESIDMLDDALSRQLTWDEKVNECSKLLLGRVEYSNQYTKLAFRTAYSRILQVLQSDIKLEKLQSRLIFLLPKGISADNSLQNYSLQPVIKYELKAPLAYATQDPRCGAVVNRHLDPETLEAFNKRNLCEICAMNAESFSLKTGVTVE